LDFNNALQFFVALLQLCHPAHLQSFVLLAKFMAKLGVLPQDTTGNQADERKLNELVKAITSRQRN
jgi:hypothetical protein